MTQRQMVREHAADRLPRVPLSAALSAFSNELTISGRLIERGSQPSDRAEGIVANAGPASAGETQCPWLTFVRKQLQAIESLPEGWDSYGAPSPDARLVRAGQCLIECLAAVVDLPQPYVNPTRNGGVQFEWEVGGRYFELEIVAERAAEYLYCDDTAGVQETGNVFEGESLEPVVAHIRRVGTLP